MSVPFSIGAAAYPVFWAMSLQASDYSGVTGDRVLFSSLSFSVRPGQKVALIGANGTGKSTLLSMIIDRGQGFTLPQSAKIGYFHQMLNTLDPALSILENVQISSRYPQ